MSEPQPKSHARIPAPIAWVQDHLLLGLLMAGSGVINARFLVYGLVPNIDDPGSWGFINTVEIGALAAAGLGLGGLEVRISYKIGECLSRSQWGRVLFLAFGMAVLAFIEFWASYSQRSQNIPLTPADMAVDGLFGLVNLSITSIAISIAIPFISVFWGFAADDPAPKPVEDPAIVKARYESQLLEAEYKAKVNAARARGIKGMIDGVRGVEEVPIPPVEAPAFAAVLQEESPAESTTLPATEPAPLALKIRGKWWDAPSFKQFVFFAYSIGISDDTALKIVREIGNDQRASERVGRPFIAGVVKLKNEAKRLYNAGQSPAIAGHFSPEMAE
jgi:hypothetical protein